MTTDYISGRVDVTDNRWVRISNDSTIIADTSIVIRIHNNNKGTIWLAGNPDMEVNASDPTKAAFPMFPGDSLTLDVRRPFELWVRGDGSDTNYMWWMAT